MKYKKMKALDKIRLTLEMIKFEHTIFVLPFTFIGAFLSRGSIPPLEKILLIVLAMASARTAAMSFNRLVDREIDSKNPRTRDRILPRGRLSLRWVYAVIGMSIALFFIATYYLNYLVFCLSPCALIIILAYSYTKRFTWTTHLFLGLAMSLGPLGGWLAIKPKISATALFLTLGVMFWGAGFDIIYACLDYNFDIQENLHSIPVRFGIKNALFISTLFHIITVVCFYYVGKFAMLSPIYFFGLAGVAILLLAEHTLVKPHDLSRVNTAFFTFNGFVSVIMFLIVALALPCI